MGQIEILKLLFKERKRMCVNEMAEALKINSEIYIIMQRLLKRGYIDFVLRTTTVTKIIEYRVTRRMHYKRVAKKKYFGITPKGRKFIGG